MVTDIRFGGVGQGEGATRNFLTNQVAKLPLVFNVKITAPFRQLLTSAKGFYDPSLLIEQNLPALMRAQEEAEAAARGETAPVQPPASEPVRGREPREEQGGWPLQSGLLRGVKGGGP